MFEKIVLRRSDNGPALTPGELAEAMLYYQKVHLVLDYGSLVGFASSIGIPRLLSLLTTQNVTATYCEDSLGTQTQHGHLGDIHSFVAWTPSGDQEVGELKTKDKRLQHLFQKRAGYNKSEAKRLVERFRKVVPVRKLTSDFFIKGGVLNATLEDINDREFIHEAIRRAVLGLIGADSLLSPFRFEINSDNYQNFHIRTDLDFNAINTKLKREDPARDEVTPALLINDVLSARADIVLASYYGGEFYTSNVTSEIIKLRYAQLLGKFEIETDERKNFTEIVIGNARSLREAVNSGTRSFDEFLKLLEKSEKFRHWIRDTPSDANLVAEYINQVASEGWISSLPAKTIRYLLGSTIGLVASPVAGLAVSAADAFLIEKIFGGWKPNYFVEEYLKPFVQPPGS